MASIYQHPLYYDILFGWDRDREAATYAAAIRKHAANGAHRILEIACGTGQIAIRLAEMGFDVTGLDMSADMLAFLGEQASFRGFSIGQIEADMKAFDVEEPFQAAICPLNSIRLLTSDRQWQDHLNCVASALANGGCYLVDLDLAAASNDAAEMPATSWVETRDGVEVYASFPDSIKVIDSALDAPLGLDWGETLRDIGVGQFRALIERQDSFKIAAVYPESGYRDGVSVFEKEAPAEALSEGRMIVVLRKS